MQRERVHDNDETMDALFLGERVVLFVRHPPGTAKAWRSAIGGKIGRPHGATRVEVRETSRGVRRRTRPKGRLAKMIGKIIVGKNDGNVGTFNIARQIGAQVHWV